MHARRISAMWLLVILIAPVAGFGQIPTGVEAYYLFDGDYQDGSGNGYDGAAYNTTFGGGYRGQAALFDEIGGGDRVALPADILDGASTFTIFLRVNLLGPSAYSHSFVSAAQDSTQHNELLLYHLGTFQTYLDHTNTHDSGLGVPDGQWVSVAWVHTPGSSELYINGQSEDTWSDYAGSLSIPDGGLWLGQDQDAVGGGWGFPGEQLHGAMDDLFFYRRALNDQDVLQLHNLPEPATLSLLGVGLLLLRRRPCVCP